MNRQDISKYKKYKKLYRLGDVIDIDRRASFYTGILTKLNKQSLRLVPIYYNFYTHRVILIRFRDIEEVSLGAYETKPNNLPTGLYLGKTEPPCCYLDKNNVTNYA